MRHLISIKNSRELILKQAFQNNQLPIFFFLENIITNCKKLIKKIYILNNHKTFLFFLNDPKNLKCFLLILKNYFKFKILSDMVAIDYLNRNNIFNDIKFNRFSVHYILNCLKWPFYIHIVVEPKSTLTGNDELESIHTIYPNANWLERECWDMFGLIFLNHTDLRRIFTDYGFKGFPLRKDFPLCGYVELRYDDSKRTLLYQPVELAQQYRNFTFLNPWNIYSDTN